MCEITPSRASYADLSSSIIAAWTAAELMLEAETENRVHWESQVGPSYHVVIGSGAPPGARLISWRRSGICVALVAMMTMLGSN